MTIRLSYTEPNPGCRCEACEAVRAERRKADADRPTTTTTTTERNDR